MPFKSKNSLLKISRCNQQSSSSKVQYIAPITWLFLKIAINPFEGLVLSKCHWFLWFAESSSRVFGFHWWRNWTPKPAEVRLAIRYVIQNWIHPIPKGTHADMDSINARIRAVDIRSPLAWTPRWRMSTLLWDIVEKRAKPRRRIDAKMNHGTTSVYFPDMINNIGQTSVKRDQAIVNRGMIMTGRSSEGNQPSTNNPTMFLRRTPTSFDCCI